MVVGITIHQIRMNHNASFVKFRVTFATCSTVTPYLHELPIQLLETARTAIQTRSFSSKHKSLVNFFRIEWSTTSLLISTKDFQSQGAHQSWRCGFINKMKSTRLFGLSFLHPITQIGCNGFVNFDVIQRNITNAFPITTVPWWVCSSVHRSTYGALIPLDNRNIFIHSKSE
jgi:hypothetical protein